MTVLPTKRPDTELAHFSWCILIAVALARREGKIQSSLQIHMFIMQWLSTAQKRKLFRVISAGYSLVAGTGKVKGPSARLYQKVEYLWLASSGEFTKQSTLFRFTCMIDTLRTMGWQDYLLSDTDWQNGWTSSPGKPSIYTQQSTLRINLLNQESSSSLLVYACPG
ncbi:hypothetical protein [Klebsiella pneumoniae]|uniref:hypothetical protein n=1 Tax=Klebsiella pneumoniae TaxID=573 RepID=UPI00296E3FD7|nr:hypothetical protein [Klebsiella pneumoniae]MDW3886180.1 DUF2913 family protein [Klebsiella pneumoniae]